MEKIGIITFHGPKFVFFGSGAAQRIPRGNAVVSPSVYRHFPALIKNIDPDPVLFSRASSTGEPCEEDILKLAGVLRKKIKSSPELPVIAVGGGSVIDGVKLALCVAACPGLTFEKIYNEGIPCGNYPRLIAAETTSGTGTAVTSVAVVTKKDNVKRGVVSPYLIPDEAYYDSDFIASLPADVFASSAMDALTHAVEAYVSTIENIPADTMALKAAEMLGKNVLAGYKGSAEAREQAHCGNMMAGQAFSNARLGLCHALAHSIGGRFGVAHGRINAILLPSVIDYNFPEAFEKYDRIASSLAIAHGGLAEYIRELNSKMGIDNSLSFLGAKFEAMIDDIAAEAAVSSLMAVNPRPADNGKIAEFLRVLYSK
ncbi:MAG: iron-containing alcohol dehydrogenase family protein [Candidatus Omnitrophota bacterium]|nr:iron-containing alcohol dehydrogenase [Candidatus Omnitrophota bacterium]MBU3929145.1 iron-containing alcohol dehydrogenase [bacterium]MBU4123044.1 iron-containing alcohol dehydrogenase [bacterium]